MENIETMLARVSEHRASLEDKRRLKNKRKITKRQFEVYEFIRAFAVKYGYPPTRSEINIAFGWASPNAAQSVVYALAKRGMIKLVLGASRGIELCENE